MSKFGKEDSCTTVNINVADEGKDPVESQLPAVALST